MGTGRRAAGRAKRWHAWAVGNCLNQKKDREPGTHNAYIIAKYENIINKTHRAQYKEL